MDIHREQRQPVVSQRPVWQGDSGGNSFRRGPTRARNETQPPLNNNMEKMPRIENQAMNRSVCPRTRHMSQVCKEKPTNTETVLLPEYMLLMFVFSNLSFDIVKFADATHEIIIVDVCNQFKVYAGLIVGGEVEYTRVV
ncbi:hypothetical protein Fot_11393 [Forsythia ovata]|uniref:Uncharacterized protein n=1 Tax=Forsythia ovata TaxID=205694 RepID=A0ABD1WM98_9LAMI